jgi:hypothetical protein
LISSCFAFKASHSFLISSVALLQASICLVKSLLKDIMSSLATGVGDTQFAVFLFFPLLKFRISSTDNAPNDAFLRVSAFSLSWALKTAKDVLAMVSFVATANSIQAIPQVPIEGLQFLHHHNRIALVLGDC